MISYLPEIITRKFTSHKDVELKNKERERIAADTNAFLLIGGQINVLGILVRDIKPQINPHNERKSNNAKDGVKQIESGNELMTVKEIAYQCNLNSKTIDAWCKTGKFIPFHKKIDGVRHWKKVDVMEFVGKLTESRGSAK